MRQDPLQRPVVEGGGARTVGRLTTFVATLVFFVLSAETVRPQDAPGLDLVFIVDNSGSMNTSDPEDWRKKAASIMITYAHPSDRAAVIGFNSTAQVLLDTFVLLTETGKSTLCRSVEGFSADGGTNFVEAFAVARRLLQSRSGKSAERATLVFFLTDGQADPPDESTLDTFHRAGWDVNGLALGAEAGLACISQVCQRTGGTVKATKDPKEILDFYLEVYQAQANESSSAFHEGVAGRDRSTFTPTATFKAGDSWQDLTFAMLVEQDEPTAPARIVEILEKGQPVWNSKSGTLKAGLQVHASALQWERPSKGCVHVVRIFDPQHPDWTAAISGRPLAPPVKRIAFRSSVHPEPEYVVLRPGERLPAVMVFRDAQGNAVTDEKYYATVRRVTARLKYLSEDRPTETITLIRGGAAPAELLEYERSWAYCGYFESVPKPLETYVILYNVEYRDGSDVKLPSAGAQVPLLTLLAEPARFAATATGDAVTLETRLSLAGKLPAGTWSLRLDERLHKPTDFWQESPVRSRIVKGDDVRVRCDPESVRINALGDFQAKATVRVPLPTRLPGVTRSKCVGRVEIRAECPGLSIGPALLQVEIDRTTVLDLLPIVAAGETEAATSEPYHGAKLSLRAKLRGSGAPSSLEVSVRVTSPAGAESDVVLKRDTGDLYVGSLTADEVGTYIARLGKAPSGEYEVGVGQQTIIVSPYAVTLTAECPDGPVVGKPIRLGGRVSPETAPLTSLPGVVTTPSGQQVDVPLKKENGRYEARVMANEAGRYEISLGNGERYRFERVYVSVGIPPGVLEADPPSPVWGTPVTVRIRDFASPPSDATCGLTVDSPTGGSQELILRWIEDRKVFETSAWEPAEVGVYTLQLSDKSARSTATEPTRLTVGVVPLRTRISVDEGPTCPWGIPVSLSATLDPCPALVHQTVKTLQAIAINAKGEETTVAMSPDPSAPGTYRSRLVPDDSGEYVFAVRPEKGSPFSAAETKIEVRPIDVTLECTPTAPVLFEGEALHFTATATPPPDQIRLPRLFVEAASPDSDTPITLELPWISAGRYEAAEPFKVLKAGSENRTSFQLLPHPEGAYRVPTPIEKRSGSIELESSVAKPYARQPFHLRARLRPATSRTIEMVLRDQDGDEKRLSARVLEAGLYQTEEILLEPGDYKVLAAVDGVQREAPTQPLEVVAPEVEVTSEAGPSHTVVLEVGDAFAFNVSLLGRHLYCERSIPLVCSIPDDAEEDVAVSIEGVGDLSGPAREFPVALRPGLNQVGEASFTTKVTARQTLPWWPPGSGVPVTIRRLDSEAPVVVLTVRGPTPFIVRWSWVPLALVVVLALLLWSRPPSFRSLGRTRSRAAILVAESDSGEWENIPLSARTSGGAGRTAKITELGAVFKVGGRRWSPRFLVRAAGDRTGLGSLLVDGREVKNDFVEITDGTRIKLGHLAAPEAASAAKATTSDDLDFDLDAGAAQPSASTETGGADAAKTPEYVFRLGSGLETGTPDSQDPGGFGAEPNASSDFERKTDASSSRDGLDFS